MSVPPWLSLVSWARRCIVSARTATQGIPSVGLRAQGPTHPPDDATHAERQPRRPNRLPGLLADGVGALIPRMPGETSRIALRSSRRMQHRSGDDPGGFRSLRGLAVSLLGLAVLSAPARASEQPLGCLLQPDRVAEIGSPVTGVLRQVHVERGDFVRKGQLLAVLAADVEQASLRVARTRAEVDADVRAAQADLEYQRQRLERAEHLRRENFFSEQALQQARAEAKVAEQRLAQALAQRRIWTQEIGLAQAQVAQRQIRAPFDGVVLERYRQAGERVEDKPILKLASLDPLRVEAFIPVSRYGQVKPGMTLPVQLDLPGADPVEARLLRVDRVVDPASNTFRIQLQLPNPRSAIPAGLRCKLSLDDANARKVSATPAPTRTAQR